jgi:cathepsin L
MKKLNGYKVNKDSVRNVKILETENLADSVDWREKGAVTPIKNQGQCGSCWSFSTTGSMEGAHFVSTGNLVSLSEQQFVDCDYLNSGCNGGSMDVAFLYAKHHAVETETDYPYTAKHHILGCKYKKDKGVVKVTGWQDIEAGSPDQLKAAINKAPVSVGIEADQPIFQQYTGGIITSDECGTQLDHGVLAVGYGSDNGQEYYIVKNSWSAAWGDQGYVKIGVAPGAGICGIQSAPTQPQTD